MNGTFRQSIYRLSSFFRSAHDDRELEMEMTAHLAFAMEDNLQRGLPPSEARRQALIRFGGPQQAREQHREARSLPFLETLLQDLRFSFRMLAKNSGFTAIAVITLALGIGATTAIFSVVYGVLLRPLPFVEPNRIMAIFEVNNHGTWSHLADPNFDDFRDQNHSFEVVAKYNNDAVSVSGA